MLLSSEKQLIEMLVIISMHLLHNVFTDKATKLKWKL